MIMPSKKIAQIRLPEILEQQFSTRNIRMQCLLAAFFILVVRLICVLLNRFVDFLLVNLCSENIFHSR